MAHQEAASFIPDGCTDVATTITVFAGDGGLFTFETGDFSRWGTIYMPGAPGTSETVYVSDVTGDVLTIARGQQGTTAQAWGANAKIVCGISVPEYEDFDVVAGSLQYAKGPLSATDGTIPLMDGTTGRLVKASAYTPSSFAVAAKGVTDGDSHTHAAGSGGALVPLAGMADLAANSIIGNNTSSPATPLALTAAQTKTLLSLEAVTNVAQVAQYDGSCEAWSRLMSAFLRAHVDPTLIVTAVAGNATTGSTLTDPLHVTTALPSGTHPATLAADAATYSPGHSGMARSLTFPGAGGEMSWGDHADFTLASGFSAIFVGTPASVTSRILLSKLSIKTAAHQAEFVWWLNAAGKLELRLYSLTNSAVFISGYYNTAMSIATVPHVYGVTWNGGTDPATSIALYRDCSPLAVTTDAGGSFTGISDGTAPLATYYLNAAEAPTAPYAGGFNGAFLTAEVLTAAQMRLCMLDMLGAVSRQF